MHSSESKFTGNSKHKNKQKKNETWGKKCSCWILFSTQRLDAAAFCSFLLTKHYLQVYSCKCSYCPWFLHYWLGAGHSQAAVKVSILKIASQKTLTEMIQSTIATGLNINKNNTKLRHYLLKLWVEGTINNYVQIIIGISCMTLKYWIYLYVNHSIRST